MPLSSDLTIDFAQLLPQFGYSVPGESVADSSAYECSNCHRFELYIEDGVHLCQACKSEHGGMIDDTAEWRNYNNDDNRTSDPSRCGRPNHPLLVESSYGTTIGYSKQTQFNRLKQLNNWQSMPHNERSLKLVFDKLSRCGQSHGLTPNIIEFAHVLFAEAIRTQAESGETKLSRGDNREGLACASLYFSCKEYEVPRSPQEIAKIMGEENQVVTRGINILCDLLKESKTINLNKHITDYSNFIERFCNHLGMDRAMTDEIIDFSKKVNDMKILTKNTPMAVASGCIYFVSVMHRLGLTKAFIAETIGVSVPTINKVYERLLPHTQQLI